MTGSEGGGGRLISVGVAILKLLEGNVLNCAEMEVTLGFGGAILRGTGYGFPSEVTIF